MRSFAGSRCQARKLAEPLLVKLSYRLLLTISIISPYSQSTITIYARLDHPYTTTTSKRWLIYHGVRRETIRDDDFVCPSGELLFALGGIERVQLDVVVVVRLSTGR
jgi:hypothetical protein